ncbi:MAG: hypothetical protein AAFO62_13255, partial [Pseudomonadota bacterium]
MSDGMERRRKHPTRRHVILGGCAVAVAGLGIGANSAWSANRKPVLVAAAANLRPVMPALLAAMGEAGVGPVRIIAHSMGGNVALRYTGMFPDMVTKLVAIEGLGPSP